MAFYSRGFTICMLVSQQYFISQDMLVMSFYSRGFTICMLVPQQYFILQDMLVIWHFIEEVLQYACYSCTVLQQAFALQDILVMSHFIAEVLQNTRQSHSSILFHRTCQSCGDLQWRFYNRHIGLTLVFYCTGHDSHTTFYSGDCTICMLVSYSLIAYFVLQDILVTWHFIVMVLHKSGLWLTIIV